LSKYNEIITVHPSNRASYEEMDNGKVEVGLGPGSTPIHQDLVARNSENPENPAQIQFCIVFYNTLAIFFAGLFGFPEFQKSGKSRKYMPKVL